MLLLLVLCAESAHSIVLAPFPKYQFHCSPNLSLETHSEFISISESNSLQIGSRLYYNRDIYRFSVFNEVHLNGNVFFSALSLALVVCIRLYFVIFFLRCCSVCDLSFSFGFCVVHHKRFRVVFYFNCLFKWFLSLFDTVARCSVAAVAFYLSMWLFSSLRKILAHWANIELTLSRLVVPLSATRMKLLAAEWMNES